MKRTTSVATLLIVALVVVTSALLGAFGARNFSTNKRSLLDNLSSEISTYADLSATSLSLAVWNLDRGQIDLITDGIMKNQNIYGVSVEAAGMIHARSRDDNWNSVTTSGLDTVDTEMTESRPLVFADEMIGTLVIIGSTKLLDEELTTIRNSTIAAIVFLELVLIASLYLLFWRMVLKPLKTIQLYATSIVEDKKSHIDLHQLEFTGELESLRGSLTAMTDLLGQRYKQLKKAHDQIQEELKHRTKILNERMLMEERLAHGQKLESLGRLAGGIAHDFNNMLSIILGNGESLAGKIEKNSPLHRGLNAIIKAAERATDITRQLLAFSRKQVMEVKTFDLNQVVAGLETMLGRILSDDIKFHIVTTPKPVFVTADLSQVEQVLINLCINARDAMPNGGTLTIETDVLTLDNNSTAVSQELDAGNYVVVSVSDTGIGMDESTRMRVFEPFFTTKEPGKGTGLGLASVEGVIKQLGGEINVYSELGRGSTFKLFLPLVEKTAVAPQINTAIAVSQGKGERILVLEDEVALREIICDMLTHLGYVPLEAKSVDDALEIAGRPEGLDLMLTDTIMPEANGPEVYERIRLIIPDLKVLYMSGYPQSVISTKGILNPGVEFIRKPISKKVLGPRIQEILRVQN